MATELQSIPEVNHQDTSEGEADDEIIEIERKAEVVKPAATKRKLCSTAYSVETQIEDYPDREEQHTAEFESLKEENIATKRNLVSMTCVLSARRCIDALASDASA